MNRKQTMAMIAYGLKIAGLEENIRNLWSSIKPVVDDDVVEKIEMRLSRLAAMTEGRQQDTDGVFEAFKERQNLIDTRMRNRDESIEALDEDHNKLSLGLSELEEVVLRRIEKIEAGLGTHTHQMPDPVFKRIAALEGKYTRMDAAITALADERDKRITALESQQKSSQDAILDLPINGFGHRIASLEHGEEVTRECRAGHAQSIATLQQQVKEHDARLTLFLGTTGEINKELQVMQQQVKEMNSRLTALTNEYLKVRPVGNKQPKTGIEWGMGTAISPVPEILPANLLALKKSEKPRKEYKKIMKKGASVG